MGLPPLVSIRAPSEGQDISPSAMGEGVEAAKNIMPHYRTELCFNVNLVFGVVSENSNALKRSHLRHF